MKLEFMEFKYHEKTRNSQNSSFQLVVRYLDISEIVVDYIIFSKTVIFSHFNRY